MVIYSFVRKFYFIYENDIVINIHTYVCTLMSIMYNNYDIHMVDSTLLYMKVAVVVENFGTNCNFFRECFPANKGLLPRRPETRFLLKSSSAILGSNSPQISIAKGYSIHPTLDTCCVTLYCRLFRCYHGQHQCLHC